MYYTMFVVYLFMCNKYKIKFYIFLYILFYIIKCLYLILVMFWLRRFFISFDIEIVEQNKNYDYICSEEDSHIFFAV